MNCSLTGICILCYGVFSFGSLSALEVQPSSLSSYRNKTEEAITKSIPFFGEKSEIRDACEYALTNGGKRFRPSIVLMVSEALKMDLDASNAALSVEFFHTASLIADDLPCMDNDDERRGRPSLHKAYDERTALLASYALITSAFEQLLFSATLMKESGLFSSERCDLTCRLASEIAINCAGVFGATGGQFFDLYPPRVNVEVVKMIIYKKTVTLFEMAFVFGWLFGGGDLERIESVRKMAYHFGMAFQIADDLGDMGQDEKKTIDINLANLIGKEKALAIFQEEMFLFEKSLKELRIDTPAFQEMTDKLYQLAASN